MQFSCTRNIFFLLNKIAFKFINLHSAPQLHVYLTAEIIIFSIFKRKTSSWLFWINIMLNGDVNSTLDNLKGTAVLQYTRMDKTDKLEKNSSCYISSPACHRVDVDFNPFVTQLRITLGLDTYLKMSFNHRPEQLYDYSLPPKNLKTFLITHIFFTPSSFYSL